MTSQPRPLGGKELVVMLGCCMGAAALSTDVILPTFPHIRSAFALDPRSPAVAQLITFFFLGIAFGQLVCGPLADRFGRRRLMRLGLVICAVSAVGAASSSTLREMSAWRFAWGFGAAAPRTLAITVVRDMFDGDRMARMLSRMMATFILVPVFAPGVASLLLKVAPWRAVFWLPVVVTLGLAIWTMRLPETQARGSRRSLAPRALAATIREVARSRETIGCMIALSAIMAVTWAYVGGAELIIGKVFDREDQFALLFGALACACLVGAIGGARLVMAFGAVRLVRTGSIVFVVSTGALALAAAVTGGRPPLWLFAAILTVVLALTAILMPLCNTLAMAPVPHVAGTAASLLGAVSTAVAAVAGNRIDAAFDGTIRPFAFSIFGLAMVVVIAVRISVHRTASSLTVPDVTVLGSETAPLPLASE